MAKEYEGDFEYELVAGFGNDYRHFEVHTPEFLEIGRTFAASLDRVSHLVWLPIELCFWTGLMVHAQDCARVSLGMSPQDYMKDGTPEFHQIAEKVYKAGATPPEGTEFAHYVWNMGVGQLKNILRTEAQNPDIQEKYRASGVEAALAAMITAAYAAFETMAADLWVAAVNRHFVLFKRYTEKTEKQISAAVVAGYDGNISAVGQRFSSKPGRCRLTHSMTFGTRTRSCSRMQWRMFSKMLTRSLNVKRCVTSLRIALAGLTKGFTETCRT